MMVSTWAIVLCGLVAATTLASAQDEYFREIISPYTDSGHGSWYWLPLVLNDSTVAWGDRDFEWELNVNTGVWQKSAHGGLNDPDRCSDPIIMPDGLWYYLSNERYLVAFDPRDGSKQIVDEYYNYRGRPCEMLVHPSGVIVYWYDRSKVHVWWPEQHLHQIRYAPHLLQPGWNLALLDDGSMACVTPLSSMIVFRSTSLGVKWDTLFHESKVGSSLAGSSLIEKFGKEVIVTVSDTLVCVDWRNGDWFSREDPIAYSCRYSVETPDTLYRPAQCFLEHFTLDSISVFHSLDSVYDCDFVRFDEPPFYKQIQPHKTKLLPDGRLLTESRGWEGLVYFGVTSATVRPFRVDSVRYSCDTLGVRLRGDNRNKVNISFSEQAGMIEARRADQRNGTNITFVRQAGYTGAFDMYLTDGAFKDTVYCPNLQRRERGSIHLILKQETSPKRNVLTFKESDIEQVLLAKWYRNGDRLDSVPSVGNAPSYITNPEPGAYHAVVMTEGYCATVTDTLVIEATTVSESSPGSPVGPATIEVYDLTGIFVQTFSSESGLPDASLFGDYRQAFVVIKSKRGAVLSTCLVLNGSIVRIGR